ncbi:helix-turn-helix domain-containing protein [Streptomyces sp. NBC_00370]|uniref:AraC-like ligand-binding domain-containing protein n=1 Tax=Streptomyces sp. NBC_00370 TaxID=2975728 RepID=UPI002E255E5A
MFETMYRSQDLPPGKRLATLNEFFLSGEHPMELVSEAPKDFHATVRAVDLAAVNVVDLALSAADVLRTPKLIRRADPELYCAVMPLDGHLVVSQAGREAVLSAPDLALYDSSRPFRLRIVAGAEQQPRLLRAHIPRALLALPPAGVERLVARPLSGRTGFGGVLAQFLTGATTDASGYRPTDLPRLGTLVQDLLTAVMAHHLDAEAEVMDESPQRMLMMRIDRFVRQRLGDPELSPGTIAAAHHISVGYLHRLFLARDSTVAAWVRDQRLESARRDLTDPALRGVPVHRIATRWGFKNHPTFTRAFRSAFGATPTDYRHHFSGSPLAP